MSPMEKADYGSESPVVADQRPILRSEPAVPQNLTGKFSWWPAMCQFDPKETVVTDSCEKSDQAFCFTSVSRASLSSFQFGAYFSASSYFASAS